MIWKLVSSLLILYLAAHYCVEGKPLYIYLYSNYISKASDTLDDIKTTGDRHIEKARQLLDDKVTEIENAADRKPVKAKEKKDELPGEFSKKDREELEGIIKSKSKD